MAGPLRLFVVFILFAAVTVPLLPLQMLASKAGKWWHKSLPHFWHRTMCRIFGFHVDVTGKISSERPLMLVSNHVSWSDILVLGSLTELSFIAKSEVRDWPMFGMLAKLQNTVFVQRDKRTKSADQSRDIAARLRLGDILVLFPEGTTSDGNRVLPVKSSLFGAARMALDDGNPDAKVYIQPVSISYSRRHGIAMGRYHRAAISWPGTVGMIKHLKRVALAGSIGVDVSFGEPVVFDQTSDRKKLAAVVEQEIRRMNQESRLSRPTQALLENDQASNPDEKPLNGAS